MGIWKLFGWGSSNSHSTIQKSSANPNSCSNTSKNKPNVIEYNKVDNYFTFISNALSGMYQTFELVNYLVDYFIDKLSQNLYSEDSLKDYRSNLIPWANDFINYLKSFDSFCILPLSVYNASSVTQQRVWYSPNCSCLGDDLIVFKHTKRPTDTLKIKTITLKII